MYPHSTSLRSLPVPGIGFCHSIRIDDHKRDLSDDQNRNYPRAVSADRLSDKLGSRAAVGTDSEQFRMPPRTLRPACETLQTAVD
jgi:hypothetical protein